MTNLLIKPAQIQQLKDEADVRSCGSEKPTTRRIFYAGLLCFHQNAKWSGMVGACSCRGLTNIHTSWKCCLCCHLAVDKAAIMHTCSTKSVSVVVTKAPHMTCSLPGRYKTLDLVGLRDKSRKNMCSMSRGYSHHSYYGSQCFSL